MLSDVEKGNNLMLRRLTPVATLVAIRTTSLSDCVFTFVFFLYVVIDDRKESVHHCS